MADSHPGTYNARETLVEGFVGENADASRAAVQLCHLLEHCPNKVVSLPPCLLVDETSTLGNHRWVSVVNVV